MKWTNNPPHPTHLLILNLSVCLSLKSCQADLVKDNGHKYFLSVLADSYMPVSNQQSCLQSLLLLMCFSWFWCFTDHISERRWRDQMNIRVCFITGWASNHGCIHTRCYRQQLQHWTGTGAISKSQCRRFPYYSLKCFTRTSSDYFESFKTILYGSLCISYIFCLTIDICWVHTYTEKCSTAIPLFLLSLALLLFL